MGRTRRLTALALLAALGLGLGYLESLLPPLIPFAAGAKAGLANIITVFALYRYSVGQAAAVTAARVLLGGLLFGNLSTLLYSLAGAALSLCVMALLQKTELFSVVGVSTAGGVSHNLAQLCVAVAVTGSGAVWWLFAVLILAGIPAGILVGMAGGLMLKYIPHR